MSPENHFLTVYFKKGLIFSHFFLLFIATTDSFFSAQGAFLRIWIQSINLSDGKIKLVYNKNQTYLTIHYKELKTELEKQKIQL